MGTSERFGRTADPRRVRRRRKEAVGSMKVMAHARPRMPRARRKAGWPFMFTVAAENLGMVAKLLVA